MCKEMLVILVNRVVDPKRIIVKNWRAEEEERHKGLLTPPPPKKKSDILQDTPTTAREALFALHKVYIERSGGRFDHGVKSHPDHRLIPNGDSAGDDEKLENCVPAGQCVCEISPLLSYAGENLEKFVAERKLFRSPTLLSE
jgi:hypothetical protein